MEIMAKSHGGNPFLKVDGDEYPYSSSQEIGGRQLTCAIQTPHLTGSLCWWPCIRDNPHACHRGIRWVRCSHYIRYLGIDRRREGLADFGVPKLVARSL